MAESNGEGSSAADVAVAGEVNRMIQVEVKSVYERLERLRQQAKFPSFDTVNIPMVLVLGNHSSGKSTFINYMLQQEVQKTGRAPTDCTFTVLVGGKREERLDGYALVRHAKYGFGDVQRLFGRDFVSQVEMKVVENSPLLDDGGLMIVDSPGMIDPPGSSSDRTDTDRGYDFKQVVRWFAERADVILVMFDPDKPGTTFETLDVLTSSLGELSSKVLLILNKVDDFRTVHDFARAYGALCWNLSRVIPRKDLPFIYTMYVPQDLRETPGANDGSADKKRKSSNRGPAVDANDQNRGVQKMLEHEFDGTRGEIVREVERAPDRATDNILNLLKATASRLKMHVTLVEACKKEYFDLETFWKRVQIAGITTGVGVAALYLIRTVGKTPVQGGSIESSPSSSNTTTSPGATGATKSGGNAAWEQNWNRRVSRSQSQSAFRYSTFFKILVSSCFGNLTIWKTAILRLEKKRDQVLQWLPKTFERVYAPFLVKTDRTHDEIVAQWKVVRPGLELALAAAPIDQFPVFELADKSYLDDVLSHHLPRLDRSVRDRSGDDHAYLRFKHQKNAK
ncbi:hypothetical protein Poli38472_006003 [Pythium oligandrum]|uniref:Dynamin N-terminal domain-containing protein n=1 Tax=Pythium oligandrum TaxID=41045 RepID=A0A8K1FLR5_PYTOL|nr:hypothetical protein Poli38472_006003 [Pythium oligandrum]|eukprot:TMW68535.1 hypothetical protein Poli38472_006003 [Pythium oligandrum]